MPTHAAMLKCIQQHKACTPGHCPHECLQAWGTAKRPRHTDTQTLIMNTCTLFACLCWVWFKACQSFIATKPRVLGGYVSKRGEVSQCIKGIKIFPTAHLKSMMLCRRQRRSQPYEQLASFAVMLWNMTLLLTKPFYRLQSSCRLRTSV